jgi:hypothetical protein
MPSVKHKPIGWTIERASIEFGTSPPTLGKALAQASIAPAADGTYTTRQICEALFGSSGQQPAEARADPAVSDRETRAAHKLTRRRSIDPEDDVTPEQIANAAVEPVPDFEPNYEGALAHAEAAQHALKLAKRSSNDGDESTAAHMTGHPAAHFLLAHNAIKAAHFAKVGNYMPANRASLECVKALMLAKAAFNSSDLETGGMALTLASQRLGIVAQSLARADSAKAREDVEKTEQLTKCISTDERPLCTMAGHW